MSIKRIISTFRIIYKSNIFLVSIVLLLGIGLGLGTGYALWHSTKPIPKMTAPQVCQYVNEALRSEFEPIPNKHPLWRYKVRYKALGAVIPPSESGEPKWLVAVEVVKEPQQYNQGEWLLIDGFYELKTLTYIERYYFYETTGVLIKK